MVPSGYPRHSGLARVPFHRRSWPRRIGTELARRHGEPSVAARTIATQENTTTTKSPTRALHPTGAGWYRERQLVSAHVGPTATTWRHSLTRVLTLCSRVCVGCAASLLAASIGAAQVDSDRLDDIVRAEMKRQHIPGVAVAVVSKGRVVMEAGYGFANIEHHVPVTPETIFQSASVGKQFTAANCHVFS